MKQQEYNEIDSLLRSWAGRERSAASNSTVNSSGAHLDADELSSYAEGALPPAARSRYTSHLIDCDECRKVVAQLAIASGPVLKESLGTKSEVSGWRKALAAFFAPAVLRYAVPALGLIVVGVLFFASRSITDRTAMNFEKREQAAQAPAVSSPATKAPSAYFDSAPEQQAAKETPRTKPSDVKSGETGEKEQATANANVRDEYGAAKQPEEPKKETTARTTEEDEARQAKPAAPSSTAQPTFAEAPPLPRPAVAPQGAANTAGGQDKLSEKEKNERKRESQTVVADGVAAADTATTGKDDDRKKSKALAARAAEGRRDEAQETHSIAGRRFQRNNGVWVDSAYKSSMPAIDVRRGSDQYRALIADEPEIATIANQLRGEVLLVWKGRAYRIR